MLCHYLAVRCLLEARELSEALQVLTDAEQEGILFPNTCNSFDSSVQMGCDDITPNVSHVSWIFFTPYAAVLIPVFQCAVMLHPM
jgi:hypothetical protein